jgi:hypothetical protein
MIKTEERCEDCKNATSTEQLCDVCIEHADNYQKRHCFGVHYGLDSGIWGLSCPFCEDYKENVLRGLYAYLKHYKIEIVAEKDGVHLLFFGKKIKWEG